VGQIIIIIRDIYISQVRKSQYN